jgi:kumamolisin
MATERFVLPGSERTPRPDARLAGAPAPTDTIDVSLLLRRRAPLDLAQPPISREAFAERYGANPADVQKVEAFAQQFDLTVVSVDLGRRTIMLSGTVAAMNEAFGTTLRLYQCDHGVYRGRAGALLLPSSLEHVVTGVFGLDNRPQAQVRCRRHRRLVGAAAAADASYTPPQIARLYQFPTR